MPKRCAAKGRMRGRSPGPTRDRLMSTTTAPSTGKRPILDTHEAQAARVADYLEANPGGRTVKEIDAACDLGCTTKVLSAMRKEMGYRLGLGWKPVHCAAGTLQRWVRTYSLISRPTGAQLDLFKAA